jgi:hypothetical protein
MPRESNPSTMTMSLEKQSTQETSWFASSKTQGIDYAKE